MKKTVTLLLLVFLAFRIQAQAPQKFDFQGVARNAAGDVIGNTTISLKLNIRSGTDVGPVVFTETHHPTTSSSGIFTVPVGISNADNGPFQLVDWKTGPYFLQVAIDVAGGSNYTNMGVSQILSVPYALHAAEAQEAVHAKEADYTLEADHAKEANRWINNDPIVQTGILGSGGILANPAEDANLIWYPRKAAFRAGLVLNDAWDDSNIGTASFAAGNNTQASGPLSVSLGDNSIASGSGSIAMGNRSYASDVGAIAIGRKCLATSSHTLAIGDNSHASAENSTAIGLEAHSTGDRSFSQGTRTFAKAVESVTLGAYNDDQDTPSKQIAINDRIFQIGNGDDKGRSNAVTILRNGNFGIGSTVLEPKYILDIAERPRIRHNTTSPNGNSAGIALDNSAGEPKGFVGMKADHQIGFFNAGNWLFWMDNNGNATISGATYNSSDRRFKRDFSSLSSSLTKLTDLNGYHYFWKDSTLDQTLQTGLIAQEVEAIFPELVKTDDKGFKSVNYTGLIPHLIESVKELKASVEYLQTLNTAIKVQNDELKAQANGMDSFRKELSDLKALVKLTSELSSSSTQIDSALSNSKLSDK
ncbi:tail fiber domain-containing protein [Dyadobacter pollutisoli]|uniref:Tail fiber domain-containing protein n=1 Tax=Dyadobacter pollutisoli TaxID=2910158 RepID=A0A9E8NGB7_9BACT|nr:tail fiber domain-containing protein [Dyadobacter pollutisoli]WAC13752.1 tail fiber domain-containing protein [Dyadobacter pollutisoli]